MLIQKEIPKEGLFAQVKEPRKQFKMNLQPKDKRSIIGRNLK